MKVHFAAVLPKVRLSRRLITVLGFLGATSVAFVLGRTGGQNQAKAQMPPSASSLTGGQPIGPSDYDKRVVAYIYKNIPITREDLGEFLIARMGTERLDFLVNRRIVEMVSKSKGVYVTDAEVQAQLQDDLKGIGQGISESDFQTQVLKRFNKTVYEWKEDVIKPKLLLQKICRPMVTVTDQDTVDAYESRFGPKVKCRLIAFDKGTPHLAEIWTEVSASEEKFRERAMHQSNQTLASAGGVVPPICKHFPDPDVEREAFVLKEGQVSPVLQLKDGSHVILKCDQILPRDDTQAFDSVRVTLYQEIFQQKLAQKIPEYFAQLRKEANPHVLLTTGPVRQEQLEREVLKDLQTGVSSGVKAPAGN